jgi:hypothetical protein
MTEHAGRDISPAALPLASSPQPNNLPESLTTFVGRSRELAKLDRIMDVHRLVTLLGPGGVGKSRIAVELARRRLSKTPDGVWLVDLASINDPELVPRAVALVLGIPEGPLRTLERALVDALRERRVLILLDNCEHLIAACAGLAELLTRECALVRILATSRERLNVDGESVVPIAPLTARIEASRSRARYARPRPPGCLPIVLGSCTLISVSAMTLRVPSLRYVVAWMAFHWPLS